MPRFWVSFLWIVLFVLEQLPCQAQRIQAEIAPVSKMPALPEPLQIRDWYGISRAYYQRLLDSEATGGGLPAVSIDSTRGSFGIKSYLGSHFGQEALTCLSATIGSKLVGLDPRKLDGFNFVKACRAWYDPTHGLYRHRPHERGPIVSDDIYGYWAAIRGMILASQYPDDEEFQHQIAASISAFKEIANGLGAPDHPDFSGLGYDFSKRAPAGRPEPMNRLGSAPSVAWVLTVGSWLNHDPQDALLGESILRWYLDHPGRYEISHVMGPLAAARLNAMNDADLDLNKILLAWFGVGDLAHHPWCITAGTRLSGITCDGLDGAKWPCGGFDAFGMGTLQGPAWLVPVVRYDARYAKAIARYALHAANSVRLLQGCGLEPGQQDHSAWKLINDPDNLFFYESLHSWDPTPQRQFQPYATGDPVINRWVKDHKKVPPNDYFQQRDQWFGAYPYNIALYMGNHIGFLGGIMKTTEEPGVLIWDCLATDYIHPPADPTVLIFNPYSSPRSVSFPAGDQPVDIYDAVAQKVIARNVRGKVELTLREDSATVLVSVLVNCVWRRQGHCLLADNVIVDWHAP